MDSASYASTSGSPAVLSLASEELPLPLLGDADKPGQYTCAISRPAHLPQLMPLSGHRECFLVHRSLENIFPDYWSGALCYSLLLLGISMAQPIPYMCAPEQNSLWRYTTGFD